MGDEISDPGSGMGKNQDLGSGINIQDLQHCNKHSKKSIITFLVTACAQERGNGSVDTDGHTV